MRVTAAAFRMLAAAGIAIGLAATTLVVAPAASAAPSGYQVVTAQASVSAGGYLQQIVHCPAGKVPLNGGVQSSSAVADDSTRLEGSAPKALAGGADIGWEVALHNEAGAFRTYTLYAVCIGWPSGYQLTAAVTTLSAHSTSSLNAACPAGKVLLGGGVALTGVSVGDHNIAIVSDSAGNGWIADLRNDEGSPLSSVVWAVCGNLPGVYAGQGYLWNKYQVGQVIFGHPTLSVTLSCPNGQTAVGGGAWTDPQTNIRIMTSAPAPGANGWTVTVRNYDWFLIHEIIIDAFCVP